MILKIPSGTVNCSAGLVVQYAAVQAPVVQCYFHVVSGGTVVHLRICLGGQMYCSAVQALVVFQKHFFTQNPFQVILRRIFL